MPLFHARLKLLLPVLLLSLTWSLCPGGPSDIPPHVTHGPILGRLTDTSVGVWMRTSLPGRIRVRYGTDPQRMDRLTAMETTTIDHDNTGWVNLTGLQPDTLYYYRVNTPQSFRPEEELAGSFRTLPSAETYRDAGHNPRGLFNFRFEIGACNNQMKGTSAIMPVFRQMLDRHRGQIAFGIQNGDWIYEEARDYPAAAWLEAQEIASEAAPDVVKVAPVITGVWANYKLYLDRSAGLREWHRHVPNFFLFDDHELLGDFTGAGNVGYRNRRTAFRDIAIRGWNDYLGWSNPRWHDAEIVFGRAKVEAGSDLLYDAAGRFGELDLALADTLMVLWSDPNAGSSDKLFDRIDHGDPNAGVYAIKEVTDATHLRLSPAARVSGEVAYSIGRPQYTSFTIGNCEFFLIDTRSYRQLHDLQKTFDPGVSFLGERQKAWLKERMSRSTADFLFVVSTVSVMLSHLEPRAKTPEQANENDAWSAAGAERNEMLDFWDSLGRPVLLLTGDLHNSYTIKVTDTVWEFLAAPKNSHSAFSSDSGSPPPNGPFQSLDRLTDIRWSTWVPEDAAPPVFDPTYCLVQVNNIFECPGPAEGKRWFAYPQPQLVIQFYSALTGELRYAESIVAPARKR